MKSTVTLLLSCALICAPAMAIKVEGNTITLDAEEMDGCRAGGGCVVAPNAALQQFIQQVEKKAFDAGKKSCGPSA